MLKSHWRWIFNCFILDAYFPNDIYKNISLWYAVQCRASFFEQQLCTKNSKFPFLHGLKRNYGQKCVFMFKLRTLALIGMRQGGFTPLINFGLDFVSWILSKISQHLEVKIEINRYNLTPCQAHWALGNLLIGGAKDEHFSYFHSSCQLGSSIHKVFYAIW